MAGNSLSIIQIIYYPYRLFAECALGHNLYKFLKVAQVAGIAASIFKQGDIFNGTAAAQFHCDRSKTL